MNVLNYEKSMNYLKNFREGEVWLSMVHGPKIFKFKYSTDDIKQYISRQIKSKSIINHMM